VLRQIAADWLQQRHPFRLSKRFLIDGESPLWSGLLPGRSGFVEGEVGGASRTIIAPAPAQQASPYHARHGRTARDRSKCRRRTDADQRAFLVSHVPEPVWQPAIVEIRIARTQNTALIANCDFDTPRNHDPTFFATMTEHRLTSISSRCITLRQNLQRSPTQIRSDLSQ
jgi:hypothetical protein